MDDPASSDGDSLSPLRALVPGEVVAFWTPWRAAPGDGRAVYGFRVLSDARVFMLAALPLLGVSRADAINGLNAQIFNLERMGVPASFDVRDLGTVGLVRVYHHAGHAPLSRTAALLTFNSGYSLATLFPDEQIAESWAAKLLKHPAAADTVERLRWAITPVELAPGTIHPGRSRTRLEQAIADAKLREVDTQIAERRADPEFTARIRDMLREEGDVLDELSD